MLNLLCNEFMWSDHSQRYIPDSALAVVAVNTAYRFQSLSVLLTIVNSLRAGLYCELYRLIEISSSELL